MVIRCFCLFVAFLLIVSCSRDYSQLAGSNSDDYLPLEIGNWWEYEFSERSADNIDFSWSESSGSVRIEVESKEQINNSIHYKLNLTKSATGRRLVLTSMEPWITRIDTFDLSTSVSINLVQTEENEIVSQHTWPFFEFTAPRYLIGPDTLQIDQTPHCCDYVVLVRNIGVVRHERYRDSNSTTSTAEWLLKSSVFD